MDVPIIHPPDQCPHLTTLPPWSHQETGPIPNLCSPEVPDYGLLLQIRSGHRGDQSLPGNDAGLSPGYKGGICHPVAVVLARVGAEAKYTKGRLCEGLQILLFSILIWGYIHPRMANATPCWYFINILLGSDRSRGGGGGALVEAAQSRRTHTALAWTSQRVATGGLLRQWNIPPAPNPSYWEKLSFWCSTCRRKALSQQSWAGLSWNLSPKEIRTPRGSDY